ncbi:MAG: signal peptidase I [Eubacteriales bacterium]
MKKHKGLNFNKKRKKIEANLVREVFSWILGVVIASILAITVVYCIGMRTSVIGISMEPTLYSGQEIFIDQFLYNISTPKQGDVVVFLPNGNEKSHYYVKRVVGVPGDSVQIINSRLYVNGELIEGNYDKIEDLGIAEQEIILGEDQYFVLGDNINDSEDSRSGNLGGIDKDDIIGKAWFKLATSESKMGLIK